MYWNFAANEHWLHQLDDNLSCFRWCKQKECNYCSCLSPGCHIGGSWQGIYPDAGNWSIYLWDTFRINQSTISLYNTVIPYLVLISRQTCNSDIHFFYKHAENSRHNGLKTNKPVTLQRFDLQYSAETAAVPDISSHHSKLFMTFVLQLTRLNFVAFSTSLYQIMKTSQNVQIMCRTAIWLQ